MILCKFDWYKLNLTYFGKRAHAVCVYSYRKLGLIDWYRGHGFNISGICKYFCRRLYGVSSTPSLPHPSPSPLPTAASLLPWGLLAVVWGVHEVPTTPPPPVRTPVYTAIGTSRPTPSQYTVLYTSQKYLCCMHKLLHASSKRLQIKQQHQNV